MVHSLNLLSLPASISDRPDIVSFTWDRGARPAAVMSMSADWRSHMSQLWSIYSEEGGWECYSNYIWPICFSYRLHMQGINRCHLAMVALSDYQKAMIARWHLLVHRMQRKPLKKFSSMYLEGHSQPPRSRAFLWGWFNRALMTFRAVTNARMDFGFPFWPTTTSYLLLTKSIFSFL